MLLICWESRIFGQSFHDVFARAQILENVEYIVAIELLCTAQAIEFCGPEKLGKRTKTAYSTIRKAVPKLKWDRTLSEDIKKVKQILKNFKVLKILRSRVRGNRSSSKVTNTLLPFMMI